MFAKINHMAIVSSNHLGVGKFYEAIFGMKFQGDRRGGLGAVTVRDGYVGLNINSRKPGRPGGLDHFGVGPRRRDGLCEDECIISDGEMAETPLEQALCRHLDP